MKKLILFSTLGSVPVGDVSGCGHIMAGNHRLWLVKAIFKTVLERMLRVRREDKGIGFWLITPRDGYTINGGNGLGANKDCNNLRDLSMTQHCTIMLTCLLHTMKVYLLSTTHSK